MLNWMRDPSKVGIPGIATGLVELCDYLRENLPVVDGRIGVMYELGTFAGEAAFVFAQYFKWVHCVDPWENACGAPSLEEVVASYEERARIAGNMVTHKTTALRPPLNARTSRWTSPTWTVGRTYTQRTCGRYGSGGRR